MAGARNNTADPMEHEYQIIDEGFRSLILNPATVHIEKLWSDGRWTEGPAYFPAHRALIWSDIPNNRMLRWTETGLTETFCMPSNYSNGNTVDRQGRLISCEHGTRRVTRTEHNGCITWLNLLCMLRHVARRRSSQQLAGTSMRDPGSIIVV